MSTPLHQCFFFLSLFLFLFLSSRFLWVTCLDFLGCWTSSVESRSRLCEFSFIQIPPFCRPLVYIFIFLYTKSNSGSSAVAVMNDFEAAWRMWRGAWPVASRVVVQLLLFCSHVWNLLSRDNKKRLFAFHSLLRVPYLCLNFFYFTTHFNTAATTGHHSLLYLSLYLLFLPFYSFSSSSSFSLHSRGGAGRGQMSCHHPTLPSSTPSLYYSQ